jgi:hypothetical protein
MGEVVKSGQNEKAQVPRAGAERGGGQDLLRRLYVVFYAKGAVKDCFLR